MNQDENNRNIPENSESDPQARSEEILPPEDRLPPEEKKPAPDIRRSLFDWAESLVTALLVIVILFSFFARTIGVSGNSMKETLHDRDYLIVSDLFYKPQQGDIVIFTKKTFMTDSVVKRVIATGGQTVNVNYQTGEVSVDGEVLQEPYVPEAMLEKGDAVYPVYVPEGYVFVMGDNRNHSTDSRYSSPGLIDERYIVGHVLIRVWPLRSFGLVK